MSYTKQCAPRCVAIRSTVNSAIVHTTMPRDEPTQSQLAGEALDAFCRLGLLEIAPTVNGQSVF